MQISSIRFSSLTLFALLLLAAGIAASATSFAAPTPAPADVDYPGLIELDVDLTDIEQRVIRTQQRIPVTPGALTLMYPRWLPGNHAPTGPIEALSGFIVHARDAAGERRRIEWRRHPLNMYAFEVDVPVGTPLLDIDLQFATPLAAEQGRRVITPEMLGLQWEKAAAVSGRPLREPDPRAPRDPPACGLGLRHGVTRQRSGSGCALCVIGDEGAQSVASTVTHQRVQFADTTLERLVDSPLFAGRHFRKFELDADPRKPVQLNVVADRAYAARNHAAANRGTSQTRARGKPVVRLAPLSAL